jgi:hypothetical protein
MIIPIDGGQSVVFQYNPYDVQISKSARWKGINVAGREQPVLQYGCGDAARVNLAIEVSNENNGDFFVKGFMDALLENTKPLSRGLGVDCNPRVQLILGASIDMCCVIDKLILRFGGRQQNPYTYLADRVSLLPKNGHVIIDLMEYK